MSASLSQNMTSQNETHQDDTRVIYGPPPMAPSAHNTTPAQTPDDTALLEASLRPLVEKIAREMIPKLVQETLQALK